MNIASPENPKKVDLNFIRALQVALIVLALIFFSLGLIVKTLGLNKEEIIISRIKITIPEGSTVQQIAYNFLKKNNNFEIREFLEKALEKEGFLFPDTYIIGEKTSVDNLISMMEDNFVKKTSEFEEKIKSSGKSLKEIITLASIVQGEVRTEKDMRLVAGILWRRLAIDMPLQTDIVFSYIFNKPLKEIKSKELEYDSPYNTYKYKGLPPGPINNPGLMAIKAVLEPTESSYLYYLSDIEGNIHYSTTFTEHVAKKKKYLK